MARSALIVRSGLRVLTVLLTMCLVATHGPAPARAGTAAGEAVKIGLIDTGVRLDRLPEGAKGDPGRNYAFEDSDTTDLVGHGTRIAGIILSIAPDVTLVPLVYYSKYPSGVPANGGIAAICKAMYDAVDVYGCKIINVSSGVRVDDPELRGAVQHAEEMGVIVVSAVGNDCVAAPDIFFYPAGYDTVIGVGAVDANLDSAPFSQANSSVTVVAPGEDLQVLSIRDGSASEVVSGTSYATAFVAAHAALLVSAYPDITPAEFRQLLKVSSRDLGDPGYDETFGWGYVDAGSPSGLLAYERMLRVKALPFSDVSISDWYCDAVLTVYENGLMPGESVMTFEPDSPVTWQMVATILCRFQTQLAVGSNGRPDSDLATEQQASVDWAIQNDLFDVGDGQSLDPSCPGELSRPITREELCAILVKYCRHAGIELPATTPSDPSATATTATPEVEPTTSTAVELVMFSDIEQASDWARDNIAMAQAAGLISGDSGGLFRPADVASKAELATLIARLLVRRVCSRALAPALPA